MAIIALDIDQTLYDFHSKVREAFFDLAIEKNNKNILKGAYVASLEWRNLDDVLGRETAEEAIERVHSKQFQHYPYDNSMEVVQELSKNNKVKYITSRRAIHWEETKRWLANWGFPEGELICTFDKIPHTMECKYLIDDRPKTIIEFLYWRHWIAENRIAFGLWMPYNQNLTDVDNVYLAPTWKALAYYLNKKNLI